jgi:hypothetical protein
LDNKDTIDALREQFEHHKVMMLKAMGAIEVLQQLDAEKEDKPKKEDKK